jgi:hypothetical protein
VALLLGAFCASFAATIGGRERDHIPAVAQSLAWDIVLREVVSIFRCNLSRKSSQLLEIRREQMRSILLYLLGIPIPIIILIGLFSHF